MNAKEARDITDREASKLCAKSCESGLHRIREQANVGGALINIRVYAGVSDGVALFFTDLGYKVTKSEADPLLLRIEW